MIRRFISLLIGILITYSASTQIKIDWKTWEEVQILNQSEKRKVFVDVYTDWCTWCKKMDRATFQKEQIAKYINEYYYAVKFDAETKEDIVFKDKVFKYIKNGKRGYNQLAIEITKGRLSFPTIVFLDEELNLIQHIAGFQDEKVFEMIMTYFAGNHFKTIPWKRYTKNYNSSRLIPSVPVSN